MVKAWKPGNKSLSCLLIFLFTMISCRGQDSEELRQIKFNAPGNGPAAAASRVDPLFFIDGQLCQHLRKMFQDRDGNLWFGTNVYGLMRYDGDSLEYLDRSNGHDYGRITQISEDSDGNMWVSTYKGLLKYDGTSFSRYTEEDGLLNNEIWCFLIDRNGIFWIGTNEGVSRFDGEKFTTFDVPKAQVQESHTIYSKNRIVGIVEDKEGNLWFGTDGFGISRYDGKAFTHYTTEEGLCDNTIHDLMVDSKGNIWIGTYFGGVSMYDGVNFNNYTREGLISGVEVCGFYEDRKGNIWFAAENQGVYRYDGASLVNFYTEEGLPTGGILAILEDREGRFWMGGWGGLFRYDGHSFVPVTREGPWAPE